MKPLIGALLLAVAVSAGPALAQTCPMMEQGGGMMMGRGMGPGMMGRGMGPGMMGRGMGHGMMVRHTEGYLAFLRAELAITKKQEPAFNEFAAAVRTQAASLREQGGMMDGGMMGGRGMMGGADTMQDQPALTLPEILDRRLGFMETRLKAMKAIHGPAKKLYASLSDEQKAKADMLLTCPRCF